MELGVPSTPSLTRTVRSALLDSVPHLVGQETYPDLARVLIGAADRYYGANLNFEHLLDLFESADALASAWSREGVVSTSEAGITQPREGLDRVFDPFFLSYCAHELQRAVLSAITAASTSAPSHTAWPLFTSFWSRLASEFELTVVTLNYDTLIDQALNLDGSHQGFAPVPGEGVWRIDPRILHEPRDHRLLHLHGSIQFGRRRFEEDPNRFCYEDSFHDYYWHPSSDAAQRSLGGTSPRASSGRTLEGGPIVSGLHKPDKLLHEPLASYYTAAANQIRTCPRLVVIGYGFGDPHGYGDAHINALLSRMTRDHGDARRIACIDYVEMFSRPFNDWIDSPRDRRFSAVHSSQRSGLLRAVQRWGECRFEFHDRHPHPWVAANERARLYYRGFLDAVGEVEDLVTFLHRA